MTTPSCPSLNLLSGILLLTLSFNLTSTTHHHKFPLNCSDRKKSCYGLVKSNKLICYQESEKMLKDCPLSCHQCQTCGDNYNKCSKYLGYCDGANDLTRTKVIWKHMMMHCRESCGYCRGGRGNGTGKYLSQSKVIVIDDKSNPRMPRKIVKTRGGDPNYPWSNVPPPIFPFTLDECEDMFKEKLCQKYMEYCNPNPSSTIPAEFNMYVFCRKTCNFCDGIQGPINPPGPGTEDPETTTPGDETPSPDDTEGPEDPNLTTMGPDEGDEMTGPPPGPNPPGPGSTERPPPCDTPPCCDKRGPIYCKALCSTPGHSLADFLKRLTYCRKTCKICPPRPTTQGPGVGDPQSPPPEPAPESTPNPEYTTEGGGDGSTEGPDGGSTDGTDQGTSEGPESTTESPGGDEGDLTTESPEPGPGPGPTPECTDKLGTFACECIRDKSPASVHKFFEAWCRKTLGLCDDPTGGGDMTTTEDGGSEVTTLNPPTTKYKKVYRIYNSDKVVHHKNQKDARARCLSIGMTLLSIQGLNELNYLRDQLTTKLGKTSESNVWWTSGKVVHSDYSKPGAWVWDGAPLPEFNTNLWHGGKEPLEVNGTCVVLKYKKWTKQIELIGHPCHHVHHYICQQDADVRKRRGYKNKVIIY